MRILCLLDTNIKPGDRWLWKYLQTDDQVDFLVASGWVDRFPKWGKLLFYYPAYLRMAIKAFNKTRKGKYDAVVAWEGKNGFPYALIRSIYGQKDPPLVILTFVYRGLLRHFDWLGRLGMRSVSHITVTTSFEVDHYQSALGLDREQISIAPFPWYDPYWLKNLNNLDKREKFILASGRSYRDYATLVKAVAGLDIPVLILARKFNLEGIELPENVKTMDLLPIQEYMKLLYQAQFVVVPLQQVPHAAGDSHLVQSMSAGKAVVASRTPSPQTYVEHGVTGLLVPPADVEQLRNAIIHLWQNPEQAEKMGAAARKSYEENYTFKHYAHRVRTLLTEVSNGHV